MKKLAALLIVLGVLSACAASPTPTPTPTPTPSATATPDKPTIPDSFKTQLTSFLQAGSKINALSDQGITYNELRQEVAAAKGMYDLLVSTWPDRLSKDSQRDFDDAFTAWNLTTRLWNMKIQESDEPVEPDINGYKAFVAFAGNNLSYETHDNNFIVKDYRGKKYLPFDENISILLAIAANDFKTGQAKIQGIVQ